MDQQKLCRFQHLRGKKAPTTKEKSSREAGKKEMALMNNLSCPCRSVSGGHHLPGQESPAAHPDITHSLCPLSCLLEYLGCLPCTSWAGSRLFPMWLQYQPKAKITEPSRCCVETGVGNGLSLKAICHVSLTCCLVFSPTSRFLSRQQKMPQRTYAKWGQQIF